MAVGVQDQTNIPCILDVLANPLQGFLVGALGAVYEAGALDGGEGTVTPEVPLQTPKHDNHDLVAVFAMCRLTALILSESSMLGGQILVESSGVIRLLDVQSILPRIQ
jgi:hypothetical protein